jgi:hypothetical protein
MPAERFREPPNFIIIAPLLCGAVPFGRRNLLKNIPGNGMIQICALRSQKHKTKDTVEESGDEF